MEKEPLKDLSSSSPTDRARAAIWLKQNPNEVSTKELMKALQVETVPRIRQSLNAVLQARQNSNSSTLRKDTIANPPSGSPATRLDLAGTLRHELAPAIGWLRLAADKEIADFTNSETNAAIKKLQRRIDGLVTLIKQDDKPTQRRVGLFDLLVANWPEEKVLPTWAPDSDPAGQEIETDDSLLSLVLSNAYQNALEAAKEAGRPSSVDVSWGFTNDRFWIRISNAFAGNSFTLQDVLHVGATSKPAHQGQGLALMSLATSLLGLAFNVEGRSGLATVSISGRRSSE
ncbi:GHKL domain-containing protein [Arthrobacter sp. Leaf137]|uniref:GHKL domain-containing protein n=1 Tax=Arthrobacter sp. Leaf137 TaxID=1736271 RepID=UPI000A9DC846|nr:GHKL domain-containing protein [Arthrobacter sp. Leaf137]